MAPCVLQQYEVVRSRLEGRKSNGGEEREGKGIFASSRTNIFWSGVVELFFVCFLVTGAARRE